MFLAGKQNKTTVLIHTFFICITFTNICRLKYFRMETKIMHNLILENEKTYSETGRKLGLN